MKKKGFTLVELLAVIVIIGVTTILISVKVVDNIKKAKTTALNSKKELIENAAVIYAANYKSELTSFNTIKVELISINTLVEKGLILVSDIKEIPLTNLVLIAEIEKEIKSNYDFEQLGKNVIFLSGVEEISMASNKTYTDAGAYVAVINSGIVQLTSDNMTSNLNISVLGDYTVTYSYENAKDAVRKIKIIYGTPDIVGVELILNLNGGSTVQAFNLSYLSGTKIVLQNPTRTGYTFTGWSVSGAGASISETTLTVGTSTTTITANWQKLYTCSKLAEPTYTCSTGSLSGTTCSYTATATTTCSQALSYSTATYGSTSSSACSSKCSSSYGGRITCSVCGGSWDKYPQGTYNSTTGICSCKYRSSCTGTNNTTYSCTNGGTLNSNTCTYSATRDAYSCSEGTLVDNTCYLYNQQSCSSDWTSS